MLHDTGKSIAVSIGLVAEKLEVGKNSALEKLDLLFFFFFFFKKWSWWFVHVLYVSCLLVWVMWQSKLPVLVVSFFALELEGSYQL